MPTTPATTRTDGAGRAGRRRRRVCLGERSLARAGLPLRRVLCTWEIPLAHFASYAAVATLRRPPRWAFGAAGSTPAPTRNAPV
jgi:hypothetical protein